MQPIGAFVAAVSDALNLDLSNQQQRPLAEGKILLGREHVADGRSPPSIVFVPAGSRFLNAQVTSSTTTTVDAKGARTRIRARPVATEVLTFEAHIWAEIDVQSAHDPAAGFSASQSLYHSLVRVLYLTNTRAVRPTQGTWPDQLADGPNLEIAGHYFVLRFEVDIPVMDVAVNFVPPNTKMTLTNLQFAPLPEGD